MNDAKKIFADTWHLLSEYYEVTRPQADAAQWQELASKVNEMMQAPAPTEAAKRLRNNMLINAVSYLNELATNRAEK